jgi:hypothetical protein
MCVSVRLLRQRIDQICTYIYCIYIRNKYDVIVSRCGVAWYLASSEGEDVLALVKHSSVVELANVPAHACENNAVHARA